MAYASFRCLVAAPVSVIWKCLERIHPSYLDNDEFVAVDLQKREIVIRFKRDASVLGERRLAIRPVENSECSAVEAILDWKSDAIGSGAEARIDQLVRGLPLEVKRNAEAG